MGCLLHPADGTADAAGQHDADSGHDEQHEGGEHTEADPVGPHPSRPRLTVWYVMRTAPCTTPLETTGIATKTRTVPAVRAAHRRLGRHGAQLGSPVGWRSLAETPRSFGVGDADPAGVDDHILPPLSGASEQRVEFQGGAVLEVVLGAEADHLRVGSMSKRRSFFSLPANTTPRGMTTIAKANAVIVR